MRRRAFITLLSSAAAWPLAAQAQRPVTPVIGFLHSGSPGPFARAVDAFRQALSESGYIESQNVAIEYRWAEGQYDRLPAFAADLVSRQVSVIAPIAGNAPALAAKAATTSIPIIFVSGGDPVSAGLVASLNRPGGNITGVSWVATALIAKQLELLRRCVGNPAVIGALVNPGYPDHDLQLRELRQGADAISQELKIVQAATAQDIDRAFVSLVQDGANALIVANDPFFVGRRDQIIALAAKHRMPAMYFSREFAATGGLLSYGASLVEATRQGGVYAGKILRGAKPADLPVLQSTKFEFVINVQTARALGIEVPLALLSIADEVIE
jgi:putative tryptophan/tyrosine transport system substrate-binding protein